jgi:hypothetical protein
VWVFLFYPSARALILGQFAIFVFALVSLALWALRQEWDILAGLCVALSTVKPQMTLFLVPLMLVWAIVERRWRFVGAFVGWMALLLGASWIAEPSWVASFLGQVGRYTSYTHIGSPMWVIAHVVAPVLGEWGEWVLSGLAVACMIGASWWALSRRRMTEFDWAVGLCLIVTNLVMVRTATTNYVILFLPLVMVFRASQRGRAGAWLVLLIEAVLLIGLWALFLATVEGEFEHPLVYLPLPFGLAAVFVARRWLLGGNRLQGADERS